MTSLVLKIGTFFSGIFFTVSHPDITGAFLDFANMVKDSAIGTVDYLGGLA
jgi:hypothetical protein